MPLSTISHPEGNPSKQIVPNKRKEGEIFKIKRSFQSLGDLQLLKVELAINPSESQRRPLVILKKKIKEHESLKVADSAQFVKKRGKDPAKSKWFTPENRSSL
jgi:hypothetical protein